MSITVLYFASLRDASGVASEVVDVPVSLRTLYKELAARHAFALAPERIRVAINGAFAAWDEQVEHGAEVAFIPPVSGG